MIHKSCGSVADDESQGVVFESGHSGFAEWGAERGMEGRT